MQVELGLRACRQQQEQRSGRACRITLHPVPGLEPLLFEQSPTCPLHDPSSAITSVIECPEARSTLWTPTDVLNACGRPYGHLVLDWPITARARCGSCGHDWEPLTRRARFRRLTCPICTAGELVETEVLTVISHDSPWASRALTQLGLPVAHIHEVKGPSTDEASAHVEITGDMTVAPSC
jgi:hypothetical protein